MKVLHITNMFSQGGVETHLLGLLPLLNDETNCVDLLVLDKNHFDLASKLDKSGVGTYVGRYGNVYNPLNIFVIRRFIRGYDLVHIHLFPTQLYAVLARITLRKKPVFVTTEHCTTNRRRKYRFFRFTDRFIYRFYDSIVGVSDAARNNLRQWIGSDDKIISILNGINMKAFSSARPYSKRELGLPDEARIITMVARFFEQKDQPSAIRAMQGLDTDIYLLLVGSGETMASCKKLAGELGVDRNIVFMGRRDDVASIVAGSDICLLSTHYEGLPISVLEYFACGKPVLATDVDGVREMIGDKSLLNPEGDHDALAHNIRSLFDDADKRERLSAANLEKSKEYTIEKMVQQYKNLYSQCGRN